MGLLIINLLEGKNLEPKDNNGLSDPFVIFKIISNETGETINKGKSKVIKKTLNPNWNEIITIFIDQLNISELTLKLLVRDWNRLGHRQSMGEAIFNLGELKPSINKDIWLNLQNGSIHLILTYKMDNKTKILIYTGINDSSIEFDLYREVKLETQMDFICQIAKVPGNPESYILQMKDTEQYITKENIKDPKFIIPNNSVVKLLLKPNLQVQAVLDSLKNETTKRKAIFDLKTQLQDSGFAHAFIEKDGIQAITSILIQDSGNTLAYALVALDCCINYGFGWEQLTKPQVIDKIVFLMDSNHHHVRSGAIKIATHLVESKNHGFPALSTAIKKFNSSSSNNLFFKLISTCITSTDVLSQLTAMNFINGMLKSAPENEKGNLIECLEKQSLTKILKEQLSTTDTDFKNQIYNYIKIKEDLDKVPIPYDKDNETHEKLLLSLWNAIFPNKTLENRISEQWKSMGFQGTDPATDFRGMGIVGLKHLIYAAKNYTDIVRTLMQIREENVETYYPVATAGINISKLLFDIFKQEEENSFKYFDILFDHSFALEEIYCISLQFFDKLWDGMEASYFSFSSVLTTFCEQLTNFLSQCKSIQQFKEKTLQISKDLKRSSREEKRTLITKKKPSIPFFKKMGSIKSNSIKKYEIGALHEAIKSGDTKKVSDLIKDGVSVNELDEHGLSPLHIAVISGNLEMIRLLLWKDADVDIKNETGWTPLHEAAKSCSLEACDILLHRGANPNAETSDGVIPFHYLVSRKFEDIEFHQQLMFEMLKNGVDINHCKNNNEETPLHYAITKGIIENVRFLLDNGADINRKNKRGYTALHMAILMRQKDLVNLLLEYNPDITISCKEGTCKELAKGSSEILKILNDYLNKEKNIKISSNKVNHGRTGFTLTKSGSFISHEANLVQMDCYHGSISKEIAEKLVNQSQVNCYLLRTSDVRGCFILTYWNKKEVVHSLISPKSSGGYSLQDCEDIKVYNTIQQLIQNTPILKGFIPIIRENKVLTTIPTNENKTIQKNSFQQENNDKIISKKIHLEKELQHAQTLLDEMKKYFGATTDNHSNSNFMATKQNLKKVLQNLIQQL